jgi:nuclear pore complex protein Nup205
MSHFLSAGRPISDAKALNNQILSQSEQKPWTLTYVHAAIRAWWLAEYSGWHIEHHTSDVAQAEQDEG